jgi:type VI secretion system protein ImpE
MMPTQDLLREGSLDEALDRLQDEVRRDPSNAKHRIFLFQLLSVRGEWNRAMTQLNVLGEMDPASLAMVQTYREALHCEALRAEVFAGTKSPVVFGEPPAWIAHLFEALKLTADGHFAQSQQLREQAFEAAEVSTGTIDDQPFEWIADGDSRLGPVLEAIVNGRYYWIPFGNIGEIVLEEPSDLRDLVWTPAYFTWANGGESPALIPTRYPGSEASEDDQIRMSRKTDWVEQEGQVYLGQGQRMLMTDTGEYALMDVRKISMGEQTAARE